MMTRALHNVVANPRIYDLLQTAVGANYVRRRLASRIKPLRDARLILDIGGGTGACQHLWNEGSRYICLDLDPQKLRGFRAKFPTGIGLNADATNIPLSSNGDDIVVCTQVTHHLSDALLPTMIAEVSRVLKPTGHFVLLDAIWSPWNVGGRLLWKYDRGSFPRPAAILKQIVGEHCQIDVWEQFAVIHNYVICVARKR